MQYRCCTAAIRGESRHQACLAAICLAHGIVDMVHLEALQQTQDLNVFALARVAYPGLQQPAQGCDCIGRWDHENVLDNLDRRLDEAPEIEPATTRRGVTSGKSHYIPAYDRPR